MFQLNNYINKMLYGKMSKTKVIPAEMHVGTERTYKTLQTGSVGWKHCILLNDDVQ